MKLSGIGGQAVFEGVMMRNKDKYAIAVRKPDNEIDVVTRQCKSDRNRSKICNVPIIRGVVSLLIHWCLECLHLLILQVFTKIPRNRSLPGRITWQRPYSGKSLIR